MRGKLEELSYEFGNGYGGYDANAIFEILLPKGYSLGFIKELMSGRYLCIMREEDKIEDLLEKYKNTSITLFEYVKCSHCGHTEKNIRRNYERTGEFLNEKGQLISETEFKMGV